MRKGLTDGLALAVPAVGIACVVIAFACGVAGRLWYPFDLEWMEGGELAHAWRLERGLPLFVVPSAEWVPFAYVPGYPAIVAALGALVPLSMPLARAVSIAGTLAAAGGIVHLVRRETGSRLAAAVGAATFLGAWPDTGAFFDIVRADGLFIGLLAWALALAFDGRRGTPLASGLLLAAAILTKQSALGFVLPVLVAVVVRSGPRAALATTVASLLPPLVLFVRWQSASDGAFSAYLVDAPLTHPMLWSRAWPGMAHDVGLPYLVAGVVSAGWLVATLVRSSGLPAWLAAFAPLLCGMVLAWWGTAVAPVASSDDPALAAGLSFLAVGVGCTSALLWIPSCLRRGRGAQDAGGVVSAVVLAVSAAVVCSGMRAHNGGYLNVLVPVFWVGAVGFVLVLHHLSTVAWRPWHHLLIGSLAATQLGWATLRIVRADLVPTEADRAAGERLVEAIRGTDGLALSPFAAWIPTYAGKPPSVHHMGLWDLEYPGRPFPEQRDVMKDAIRDRHWSLVLGSRRRFPYPIEGAYEPSQVFEGSEALSPKTGWKAWPDRLLVPKL